MRHLRASVLASIGIGLLATTASAALITNGDFQTGDATGWSALAPGLSVDANAGPGGAGDYALHVACADWIVATTANNGAWTGAWGNTYTVSFDIKMNDTAAGRQTDVFFQKEWGGNYPAYAFLQNQAPLNDGQWHTVSWSFYSDSGGFRAGIYTEGGSGVRDFYIDNLQVTVPEPTMVGVAGLAGLACLRRRRTV